jgi:hypothetical protein
MSAERPIPEDGIMDQDEQARLLVQTGEHTHPDETEKLTEEFGEPDAQGVFAAPVDPAREGDDDRG